MTGLIYVAIIAVWAVVLVPAWLRRHDHRDPERSVDRFSRSMQTLAQRPSVLGIPMPSQQPQPGRDVGLDEPAGEVFRLARPDVSQATARVGAAAAQARSKVHGSSAALRRRVVLGVLTVGLVAVGALVVTGVLLPIALAVPATLIVGFLGIARHQVRAARARRTVRERRARPEPLAATTPAARPPAPRTPAPTWEARSTPLPTYVTAPPAAGFPRVIDTETPGAWTAAAMLERAQQEKMRAERMAAAKAEAIAKAKAEQAAAESRSRDEDFLAGEAAHWDPRRSNGTSYRRRVVNE